VRLAMDLPQEIALEIVSHVDTTKDLRSIALSCRAFRGPAQLRIFEKLDLLNAAQGGLERLYEAFQVNPSLGELVQELSIGPIRIQPDHLVSFLQKLSHIRSLDLQWSGNFDRLPKAAFDGIKGIAGSSSLTRLRLASTSLHVNVTVPLDLLLGANNLQELEVLPTVKFIPFSQRVNQRGTSLSNLQILSLPSMRKTTKPYLSHLFDLLPRSLNKLHIDSSTTYEDTCSEVLEAIGELPLLQYFVYSLSAPYFV
jgi:hypothetical protein